MTNLSVFNFESHEVRFVGTASDPWWVAQDVCKVLDIKSPEDAYSRLDDDEKQLSVIPIAGQNRSVMIINESGLYSLVLTSRKAQAKRFKKWLTSEVLPAIRKTGTYAVSDKNSDFKAKVTELDVKRKEIKSKIDALREHVKQLEDEYIQLEIEESKLYVLNNRDIGEEYIKHKKNLETAKANIYLPKGK